MEGVLKKKVSILRGFEDKWFELKNDGFLECYEVNSFQYVFIVTFGICY